MKSIVISSNGSGGGKTTVTFGLIQALKQRGLKVQSFKVGPDYIDPAFHSHISGQICRNLDLFLMGEEGVRASFSRGKGDVAIIEGVMGLYDGRGISTEYSTAHVAKTLDLPVVLVLSPKAQVATLCAEINGLRDFEDIKIAGILLNNISESYYILLKAAIEKNCKIKVFGYLPKAENLVLKSRHLGLVQSSEIEDLDSKIESCGQLLEQHVDIDGLLSCLKEVESFQDLYHVQKKGLKIAVAKDKAFSFYYAENLELLEEIGEVVYFSPLYDKRLPKDVDFLYLGGGYPEVFSKELSTNREMCKSILNALESGLPCYAECGGFMYLTEQIEGNPMVGFFRGESFMTARLQNFGYCTLRVEKENSLFPKGLQIPCHEFHKSYVRLEEENFYTLTKEMYDGTQKKWNCGYIKKNTVAQYAHVHFWGNMEFLNFILNIKAIKEKKDEKLY